MSILTKDKSVNPDKKLQYLKGLLKENKFELANRICIEDFEDNKSNKGWVYLLHETYRGVCNMTDAINVLTEYKSQNIDDEIFRLLLLGEDYHVFSSYAYFRTSPEKESGYTGEEYELMKKEKSEQYFSLALSLADTDDRKALCSGIFKRCGKKAEYNTQVENDSATPLCAKFVEYGFITGTILFPNGKPVSGKAVLGLHVDVIDVNPEDYCNSDMHFAPEIGEQRILTCDLDDTGRFTFSQVDANCHEFIAVMLDPYEYDISTVFVDHNITIKSGETLNKQYTLDDWKSTATYEVKDKLPQRIIINGKEGKKIKSIKLNNPFYFNFDEQLISIDLQQSTSGKSLCVVCSEDNLAPIEHQMNDKTILFFAKLPAISERVYGIYEFSKDRVLTKESAISFSMNKDGTAIISTGLIDILVPYESCPQNPLPPIISLKRTNEDWHGNGHLVLPQQTSIISQKATLLEQGSLIIKYEITYTFSNQMVCSYTLTAHKNQKYIIVEEISSDNIDGYAFELSFNEFLGGRGHLHWTPDDFRSGNISWNTLKATDKILARLQESVPWWIPTQGFGYSFTSGKSKTDDDFISVFTLRRGEWIDRKFEAVSQGPVDNYELDWPYPEMVGSTISMITAQTSQDGDVFYRFKSFDGKRIWGISASTLGCNDGPSKEISHIQHKLSSPRLQDFKDWELDCQDLCQRPFIMTKRSNLINLRNKKSNPFFEEYWHKITTFEPRDLKEHNCKKAVQFAIDGDPLIAWNIKRKLVGIAKANSRMILLGRDYSDVYSPVGARSISAYAEEYDLIAASGVFTPKEERVVRNYFMLMAYMYMEPDFMNWKFNGRNTNFEADRIKVIGNIGIAFNGNSDSKKFIDHSIACIKKTIDVYTTPKSGKWYENPACYYMQSLTCRMNLVYKLYCMDLIDITSIPKIKEFLLWGILLLTPAFPHDYCAMRDGCTQDEYTRLGQSRRIPPVGDHARLGLWVTEYYALIAKVYKDIDPEFSNTLLWAYIEGGRNGGHMGNMPLLFCQLEESDLIQSDYTHELVSRRLEGFGSIFRYNFNYSDEAYLLFKLGPGGYRYHRTEGSIIYFANGTPLIFDGGEAGETWRHSTLSFYDVHMPLAPGHIERFYTNGLISFSQGVNPVVLKPNEPIFLNDECNVELIELAYKRFNEPNPANSRSITMVGGDYFVMHDELNLNENIPSYWHLQVVADSEIIMSDTSFRFKGRYGTDLQVTLPGQVFQDTSIQTVEHLEYNSPSGFSMRHLQLKAKQPTHYMAVISPITAERQLLTATEIVCDTKHIGVHVQNDEFDDYHVYSHNTIEAVFDRISFRGKYLSIVARKACTELIIEDGEHLTYKNISIKCNSTGVAVKISEKLEVEIIGSGEVEITYNNSQYYYSK